MSKIDVNFVILFIQNYGHMDDKSKLFEKKQYGDIITVSKMLNVSQMNATQLLRRTNAKRHNEAISALAKIIESRDKLFQK